MSLIPMFSVAAALQGYFSDEVILIMRVVSLFCMTLLSLPAIALVANAQTVYPRDVVAQYIEDCTAGRDAQARAVCTCIINGIQSKYSYEEFQILNSQISQTGNIPVSLSTIIKTCKGDPDAF